MPGSPPERHGSGVGCTRAGPLRWRCTRGWNRPTSNVCSRQPCVVLRAVDCRVFTEKDLQRWALDGGCKCGKLAPACFSGAATISCAVLTQVEKVIKGKTRP